MVLRLRGDGVGAAELAAAADRLRLPAPSPAVAAWQVLVVGGLDQARLERGLDRPSVACIEWRDGVGDAAVSMTGLERCDGLYLSLTTATAYQLQPSTVFRNAAVRRFDLSASAGDALELAVHEAVANAVLHGNLGLQGMAKNDPGQLDEFAHAVEERLAVPALAARRVHVWAEPTGRGLAVTVADEGEGYCRSAPRDARADRKSGRGLDLIRALSTRAAVTHGGRWITMDFAP